MTHQMTAFDLEHPQLLSDDVLKRIFLERKIKIADLENLSREQLLEIYNRYCLPYPQRKPRERRNYALLKINQNVKRAGEMETPPSVHTSRINVDFHVHIDKKLKMNDAETGVECNKDKNDNAHKHKLDRCCEINDNFNMYGKKQKMDLY